MCMTVSAYAQDTFDGQYNFNIYGANKKELSSNYVKIKFTKVAKEVIRVDDTVYWEIEDYSDSTIVALQTARVEKVRHLNLKRTSDDEVMIQWSLHGVFIYDGTTSQCTDVWMNVYNYNETEYTITNKSYSRSGMWAIGNCGALNKKTTKSYSNTIKIGVQPDGTVLKS